MEHNPINTNPAAVLLAIAALLAAIAKIISEINAWRVASHRLAATQAAATASPSASRRWWRDPLIIRALLDALQSTLGFVLVAYVAWVNPPLTSQSVGFMILGGAVLISGSLGSRLH